MTADAAMNFGPFCLLPRQRILLKSGVPVRLGSRAFDLLVALAERPGEVVSNAELIARVWPKVVIESGALRVHLTELRKVLGDRRESHRYIVNVPTQGYCFVAEVSHAVSPANADDSANVPANVPTDVPVGVTAAAAAAAPAPAGKASADALAATPASVTPDLRVALPLPAQLVRMIGRDDMVADLARELSSRRCVTVTGPAGMGKTTVALAAARRLSASFGQQAVFVNLAPLNDPALITNAVTAALGAPALEAVSLRSLIAYLQTRRILIVLDNCEHVIEAAAELAESLLTGAPEAHLLATSREPLRIQGEWVQRLGALPVPPSLDTLDVHQALRYPSAELFVERVRASQGSFALCEADVPALVGICRALDGIPLALELAAAGVERLGMRGLYAQLGNRLAVLTRGRRTALPRHQTLRAALDWSYALLPENERRLLRSLAMFRGRFTADGARAVAQGLLAGDTDELLHNLVSKSLLMSDIAGESVQYWLLETTREYGLAQLSACPERAQVGRLHALHMLATADAMEQARPRQARGDWLARHAYLLDDIRLALHWSLSDAGDVSLGAALAAASAPLWYALSHMAEYLELLERLLERMPGTGPLEPAREIAMREAHGHALWNIRGAGPAAIAAFERSLEVARQASSVADQLHALWGLWLISNSVGDYGATVRRAQEFGALAVHAGDAADAVIHERMMTWSMHFTGHHEAALRHARRVLCQPLAINLSARRIGFQFDQGVAALTALARILWIQGMPEQSLEHAEAAVERAQAIDHSLSLCFAIAVGCGPAAFWTGELDRAERYTALLRRCTAEYSLTFWGCYAEGFLLVLSRLRDDGGVARMPAAWPHPLRDMLCTFDATLAGDDDFARARHGLVPWSLPELRRIEGERLRDAGKLAAAAERIRSGLRQADAQGALALSLRCAMSLAALTAETGSIAQARSVLGTVYDRFREGFDTADLRAAAALLGRLG
ncbi:winged helix-turn-helix domain-containing protein [Cupriavidus alkaliphilus]|uniref:Putative ATPase/DNA-binding winged helix-turn-helix (WHTH) protein n=1 Tax=Cupriavidus alkaliphilus TaxID=942866 RepID=A0A7W4VFL1_9BURK|nr:winged helix-turn-helix domain-containing protein [Cupriavidus alkaliphilus]MBB3010742.1 putative ATPase/DNA-binding winged helix-turn-helix (wHTH) protein [Cupriavidus alkaliphilus]PVY70228.1 putative ATPase [Cupriavidus alkaliphilus]